MPNRASRHQAIRCAASGSETSGAHWGFSDCVLSRKRHTNHNLLRRENKRVKRFTFKIVRWKRLPDNVPHLKNRSRVHCCAEEGFRYFAGPVLLIAVTLGKDAGKKLFVDWLCEKVKKSKRPSLKINRRIVETITPEAIERVIEEQIEIR